MKHLYASRWDRSSSQTAADIFLEELTGNHEDNPFITKALKELYIAKEQMIYSIFEYERDLRGKEAERADKRFNRAFRQFRNLAKMQSSSEFLGDVAASSRNIVGIIKTIKWDLHKEPYPLQISLGDLIISQCENEYRESLEISGLLPLFAMVKKFQEEMKLIVDEQGEIRAKNRNVPAPYKVAEQIPPLIQMLHTHLTDFAKLDPENYEEPLRRINFRLKSVVNRMKQKHTRAKKN